MSADFRVYRISHVTPKMSVLDAYVRFMFDILSITERFSQIVLSATMNVKSLHIDIAHTEDIALFRMRFKIAL